MHNCFFSRGLVELIEKQTSLNVLVLKNSTNTYSSQSNYKNLFRERLKIAKIEPQSLSLTIVKDELNFILVLSFSNKFSYTWVVSWLNVLLQRTVSGLFYFRSKIQEWAADHWSTTYVTNWDVSMSKNARYFAAHKMSIIVNFHGPISLRKIPIFGWNIKT